MEKIRTFFVGCMFLGLLNWACASENKIAEELAWRDTEDTGLTKSETDSEVGADSEVGSDLNTNCRAGGGDEPCSVVTACETRCGTNTMCLGDCRSSLCTAHEAIYCDMANCISSTCGEQCTERNSSECLLCISIHCAAATAICSTATLCGGENN